MHKRLAANIAFCLFLATASFGQEVVTGLQFNPSVAALKNSRADSKGLAADPVELPFFDDFARNTIIPSPLWWSDNHAFVNNTYSLDQPTMGMATLDAIDNSGKLYENASSDGFEADHLTSQPINLAYPESSNIWLSFFYQAGGLGDMPEPSDSLTLHFYAPEEDRWYSVWKTQAVDTSAFIPAIIRIDDPKYLRQGFMFRFVNWATLSTSFNEPSMLGNCDHWNIDYVLLDLNRNAGDTLMRDVAFRTPMRTVLKTHEAMPWKQFRQVYLQEMGAFIPVKYRNNDNITRNVTRNFEIRDIHTGNLTHSFSAGASNIDHGTDVDYNAGLIYTFNNNNSDSALFRITSYLITDEFDPKTNDTITYHQVFSNYFAFDDGTAEGGYGINGQGSRNAMAAYRFRSFIQDTVRAINICFNDSYMNRNRRAFDLAIWNDNNGIPGEMIYSVENLIVEPEESVNGFRTYILPDGIMVDGIFYIGWRQRSETFLNVGFDVNTPHRGRQYFWLNGIWQQSQKEGSIMIRPVVGPPVKTTSSDDIPFPEDRTVVRIWPNPASDYINIDYDDISLPQPSGISVIDLQGRELLNEPYQERLNISSLRPGIYTVIIKSRSGRSGYFRLIKRP